MLYQYCIAQIFNTTRGSYADIAETKEASHKFIQNQLGHTKAQTTLNVYMKNSQDMVNDALEKMNNILKK